MIGPFSQRLLTLLQLTRMALVFTAAADIATSYRLRLELLPDPPHGPIEFSWWTVLALAMVSGGLYGFGMSLNDIVDYRRDQQIAADRPLPSGRIGIRTAHVICLLLALLAAAGGLLLSIWLPHGNLSLYVLLGTVGLIVFYDFAGKYLVALGLITLGLIRVSHALIAAPHVPLLWHPLWLLNHIVIFSAVAYVWEQKRPVFTRPHLLMVLLGLVLANAGLIGFAVMDRANFDRLPVDARLLWPIGATVAMLIFAFATTWQYREKRMAGKRLMLTALLWLIVYDAAFLAGYVNYRAAGIVLLLLPMAWGSVRVMRLWSRLATLAVRPAYIRA